MYTGFVIQTSSKLLNDGRFTDFLSVSDPHEEVCGTAQ